MPYKCERVYFFHAIYLFKKSDFGAGKYSRGKGFLPNPPGEDPGDEVLLLVANYDGHCPHGAWTKLSSPFLNLI